MQFFSVKKWCSANVFSDTKQKHVSWKICKVRKIFDSLLGSCLHFIFNVKRVEIRKMSEVFWANMFCWLWDFLLEIWNQKKKKFDAVYWNMWINIKKLYARNNIFNKIIPNMRFWIIYISVQILFLGDCFRMF